MLSLRVLATGVVLTSVAVTLSGCNPTVALSLKDGSYTCGPVAGSDMNHMVVLTDANGGPVDIFATVTDGEVTTLDLGRYGEVSDSIDGFTKQSRSRFNVRLINEQGGNGKFFTTGDPVDDTAGWGNWLLCAHDG